MSNEWNRHVEVTNVKCSRTANGDLNSAKVHVEYFEFTEDEYGEFDESRMGQSIRFRFKYDGETASLAGWKDASTSHAGWVSQQVLRCLPAAEHAVSNIPDVEHTADVFDTLHEELDVGASAYVDSQE